MSEIKIKKEYVEYFMKFRDLIILHKKLRFGENPQIPSVFSQNICRSIYKLNKWKGGKFDAKNKDGKAIEIKATGTKIGTTSININSIRELGDGFGGLYWMYFDFNLCEIKISFLEPVCFESIKPAQKNERNNITLRDYVNGTTKTEYFKFEGRIIKIKE